jgi:hypothetical protein
MSAREHAGMSAYEHAGTACLAPAAWQAFQLLSSRVQTSVCRAYFWLKAQANRPTLFQARGELQTRTDQPRLAMCIGDC